MDQIWNEIKKFNQIVIYRHVNPDLDAFGSQLGIYFTLKELFPMKKVILQGKLESDLLALYSPVSEESVSDEDTLGIVLDTANRERIDGDLTLCNRVVKIDHHIIVDSYGDINLEVVSASSCSEIVALLFKENNVQIPLSAANALYLGIVGDSNRFLYSSTSVKTFEAASYLLEAGINIEKLYQSLYMKKKVDLDVTKFIYNRYHDEGCVAYYYLSSDDLKDLKITREQGSNYVNTLANIEEFKVWMAITQNEIENNYRVSIRSREVAINEVASEFRGGGHAYASGATLLSLDELPLLIEKLKEKING